MEFTANQIGKLGEQFKRFYRVDIDEQRPAINSIQNSNFDRTLKLFN